MKALSGIWRLVLLRDRPLTVKLLVYSALLIVVPMLVIGVVSYRRSAQVMEEEARAYSRQIIEQVKTHVEYYINDPEINLLRVVTHPDMRRLFELRTVDEAGREARRAAVRWLLQEAVFSQSDMFAITVFLDDGKTVETAGALGTYPAEDIRKAYWYGNVPDNGESIFVTRIIPFRDREEPVLSIVQRLIDPSTLEPAGLIIVDVNYKRLREMAEKVTIGQTGYMFIIDRQGHYVYHPDPGVLGQRAPYPETGRMLELPGGALVSEDGNRRLLTFSRSAYLDWTIGTDVSYKEIVRGTEAIGDTIAATVAVTLLVSLVLGVGFGASIVRPVWRLAGFMKKVQTGDFSGSLAVESRDEIGSLTVGFNRMVERLRQLHEEIYVSRLNEAQANLRHKEAELKMLQSQMNPHFLYNSLETIRGMALECEREDIAEMSAAMARLLRYSLRNDRPVVTVREELHVCELYLRVQRYRFGDKLSYSLDVPDWALEQEIAKFALQPLVENSVIHGTERSTGATRISTRAGRAGDRTFRLCVEDTGAGIPPERIAELRAALDRKDAAGPNAIGSDAVRPDARIGILNVHRRIAYLFGEEYGLSIDSEPGRRTVVTLRLPYREPAARAERKERGQA